MRIAKKKIKLENKIYDVVNSLQKLLIKQLLEAHDQIDSKAIQF
jgi:hypothetical protein